MKKQLYIIGLILSLLSNQTFTHFNELIFFNENDENSKWSIMEKKFISDIEDYKSDAWDNLSMIIPATIITGSLVLSHFHQNNEFSTIIKPSTVYPTIGFTAGTLWALQSYKTFLRKKAAQEILKDFFINWEQNQFFIPKELQEGFDILAEQIDMHGIQAVEKNAAEIIENLQWIIMRRFEKRYEKILQLTAENSLSNTKLFTEIIKNVVNTGSFLNSSKK